eukprot:12913240-Alexandrium_andersonii.AAC.1
MAKSPVASWFVDGDVVWLREVLAVVRDLPEEAAGHFFGSAARPACMQGKTRVEFEKNCLLNYLARPRDGLVLATPFRCPRGSPYPPL